MNQKEHLRSFKRSYLGLKYVKQKVRVGEHSLRRLKVWPKAPVLRPKSRQVKKKEREEERKGEGGSIYTLWSWSFGSQIGRYLM